MTALSPATRLNARLDASGARGNPSPSKYNPFARATPSSTIKRATLLPVREGVVSPSAGDAGRISGETKAATTPEGRKPPWRMLWRGGLEVGPDGWRLDGITFFAQLAFANATPGEASGAASAFAPPTPGRSDPALPSDADLCLSLESLRGRRYISVRGVQTLSDTDVMEGDDVQMGVASPLISAFFTGILCRSPQLTPLGRTTLGVVLGLGDEGVDAGTVLVYGQHTADGVLRLRVGRKRPPPPPERVRPGEPLPRAPPSAGLTPAARPVPVRGMFTRAASLSAMHRPPPVVPPGRNTPGRRGEKRARRDAGGAEADAARRRGRIVPDSEEAGDIFGAISAAGSAPPPSRASSARPTRAPSLAPSFASALEGGTQQLQDNKATMVLLGERGCARDDPSFISVFGATTKGVYFALRQTIDGAPVAKPTVRDLVRRHLDMYLPLDTAEAADPQSEGALVKEQPDERPAKRPQRETTPSPPAPDSAPAAATELLRTPQQQVH